MGYNTELYHWGIKGMKWGVRRYQNKDGSLTEVGKRRLNASNMGRKPDKQITADQVDPNKWVKDDFRNSKKLLDETRNMSTSIKNANENAIKKSKERRPKMDLSNMSDKEMRDAVNRKLLEKQYIDIFSEKNVSKGREFISNSMDVFGTVTGIASSALAIALTIKELRG